MSKFNRSPGINPGDFLFIVVLILVHLFIFISSTSADENGKSEKSDIKIPEGMTTIQIGDTRVVVPRDGRVRHEGGIYFIETADEYAARKAEALNALQKRVDYLESVQRNLEKDMEKMKASQIGKTDEKP